ncbi:hypothetical protein SAMN02745671_00624 [Anaerovibrio lipolyticus DSM 3074]|uniref:Carrier domain-containing protein n=2 Tax=Anaerovibrio lipolyticus TaxID=82374 RepID=A0A0B2JTG4_9FIRM|nr:hypothetical protein [Anaerovibrio lipolyticus]KHM51630.1 hypothetical protein NZ47_09355 [Anaerovibrio lipolyticus]MBO5588233.1 hypothetical protein [Anaerovibrio sp.]SHI44100.1 hypothetical protein SAMN02745671_00624 [Anaerovibrio lipolyticus DSM 3074]
MTEQEFIEKMQEDVLDTDVEISLEMALADVEEWDSLSFVSFIAMAKELGFTNVNREVVNEAKTVKDLFELMK